MRGAALRSLIAIADQMGFTPRAVKLPLEEVPNLDMPAVLHWDLNHYVVLEQVKRGRALIHNPDGTSKWYRLSELSKFFTGVALELRPADNFEPADKRERLKLSQLWRRMRGPQASAGANAGAQRGAAGVRAGLALLHAGCG